MLSTYLFKRCFLRKMLTRNLNSMALLQSPMGLILREKKILNIKSFSINASQLCSTGTAVPTAASTATTTNRTNKLPAEETLLKKVLRKVGLEPNVKTRLRVSSRTLYESVADKINYLEFFTVFNMPNTFNSWFLVTELHVWMLLLRSMAEGSESGEDGRFMRNCIVEVMWNDVNARAKKLGSANPSLTRKQIGELSEQFQAALIAYDEGIMSDDRVLAAALWRRFFAMNCTDYTKIELLVNYVRFHVHILDKLPRDNFLFKSHIKWHDLNKFHVI